MNEEDGSAFSGALSPCLWQIVVALLSPRFEKLLCVTEMDANQ